MLSTSLLEAWQQRVVQQRVVHVHAECDNNKQGRKHEAEPVNNGQLSLAAAYPQAS